MCSFIIRIVLTLACALASISHAAEALLDPDSKNGDVVAELEQEIAIRLPDGATDLDRCVFLHKRGEAYLRLGRNDEAFADLKAALELKRPAGRERWCDRWLLQNDIVRALRESGDHLSLIDFEKAVGEEYKPKDKRRYFFTQIWLVDPYTALGRLNEAERAFQNAAEVLPALRTQEQRNPVSVANLMEYYSACAAWLQVLRGNWAEAERYRRDALRHLQERYELARANLPSGHPVIRDIGADLASRLRQLADPLMMLGRFGEAELLARQSLQQELAYRGRDTTEVASSISTLANVKLQQGDLDTALNLRRQGLKALEGAGVRGYSTTLAGMRAQIGFLLGVRDRWDEALDIFGVRDHGLRGNAEQFVQTGSRNMDWAMALLKTQHGDEAEDMLKGLIVASLKQPFVDPIYLAYLRGYYAQVLLAAGKRQEAFAEYRQAMPVLMQQQANNLATENGGFVFQYRLRLIGEGYLELLAQMSRDTGAPAGFDPIAEAFRVAEVVRGSRVQQAIASSAARANLPDPELAKLARQEQDIANQIGALNTILIRLASNKGAARLDETISAMRADVEKLESKRDGIRRSLTELYPGYANLMLPKSPEPSDLQRLLGSDEAAVAFYVAEKKTYVWTVTSGRIAFREVEISRGEVESLVASLRQSLDLTHERVQPFDSRSAQRLHSSLLAPDAALWANAKTLNVITHGALGQIPLALLLTGAPSGENLAEYPWLLRKVAVAQQASVGSMISLREQRQADLPSLPFIGFGNPLFSVQQTSTTGTRAVRNLAIPRESDDFLDKIIARAAPTSEGNLAEAGTSTLRQSFSRLPPLPDTALELHEIGATLGANEKADVFLAERATEGNVKGADLSAYRVVAFATHGLVPGDLPELDQPSLAMANPALTDDRANDGFLTLSEILGLKLNADWVVLSACNTAGGDGKSEEAVSGLGRAFFFSGARRLLVSYWPVETTSARLLTTELFRRQNQQPGESKAEALRYSMLKLMSRSKQYAHPAFWAPFGLIGEAQ